MSDKNYVFSPLACSAKHVEKILIDLDLPGTSCHVFSGDRLAVHSSTASRGTVTWENNFKTKEYASLLDASNHENYERFIMDNLSQRNIDQLGITKQISNFTLQKIDQNVIETPIPRDDVQNSPLVFALSKQFNNDYYDLIFTHLGPTNKLLYFAKQRTDSVPYSHSGDVKNGTTLLHSMIMKERIDSISTGVVTAHAYNKRSFQQISHCQPSICIPDYGKKILHFIPCPLTPDIVKNSDVNHIVKYTIDPGRKSIRWIFPFRAVYEHLNVNVGCDPRSYSGGFKKLDHLCDLTIHHNEEQSTLITSEKMKMTTTTSKDEQIDQNDDDNNESCEADDCRPLMIAQAGIPVPTVLLRELQPEFVFDCQIRNAAAEPSANAATSALLPLAAGTILYGSDVLMHGRAPDRNVAQRFARRMRNASRVIVVVGDNYKTDPALRHTNKLNAIYVIVPMNEKIVQDQVNASMALAHQGPLSTVICFTNGVLRYHRGIWDGTKYGDEVLPSTVLKEGRVLRPGLVAAKDNRIYNTNGKCVIELEASDVNTHLFSIMIENFLHIPRSEFLLWLGQLEVLLSAAELRSIVNRLVEKMTLTRQRATKLLVGRDGALRVLQEHFHRQNFLGNEPFSKKWLATMCREASSGNLKEASQMFNRAWEFYRTASEDNEWLLAALNNTTSARSSQGSKSLDILKKNLRRDTIATNVKAACETDLDDLMSNHCQKVGAVIYKVDNTISSQYSRIKSMMMSHCTGNSENLLSINARFPSIGGDFANSLLPESTGSDVAPLSFNWCVLNNCNCTGCTYCEQYLLLPVSDAILELMVSEQTMRAHDWRSTKEGNKIDLTRIIVRNGIHGMMKNLDFEAGHPNAGNLALFILASAMRMTQSQFTSIPRDPKTTLVQTMRYLFGLCLSIMASGTNAPLSDAYRIFAHSTLPSAVRLNLEHRYVIDSMVEVWPYLCFTEMTPEEIKERVTSILASEADRTVRCIFETVIKPKYKYGKFEDTKQKLLNNLKEKSKWSNGYVRPMCLLLLKQDYPFMEELDSTISDSFSEVNSDSFPEETDSTTSDIFPEEMKSTNTLITVQQLKQLKNLLEKRKQKREWIESYTTNTPLYIGQLSQLYDEAKLRYPKFTEASRFMTIVKKFLDKKVSNVNYIRQVAHDKYIKCVDFLHNEKKKLWAAVSTQNEMLRQEAIKDMCTAVLRMKSIYSTVTKITKADCKILEFIMGMSTLSSISSILMEIAKQEERRYFSVIQVTSETTDSPYSSLISSAQSNLVKLVWKDDKIKALIDWARSYGKNIYDQNEIGKYITF